MQAEHNALGSILQLRRRIRNRIFAMTGVEQSQRADWLEGLDWLINDLFALCALDQPTLSKPSQLGPSIQDTMLGETIADHFRPSDDVVSQLTVFHHPDDARHFLMHDVVGLVTKKVKQQYSNLELFFGDIEPRVLHHPSVYRQLSNQLQRLDPDPLLLHARRAPTRPPTAQFEARSLNAHRLRQISTSVLRHLVG